MASTQYTKGLLKIIDGSVDLLNDNIKLVLVDTAGYTADLDNDEFLSAIPAVDRVGTSPNLASKTLTIDTTPNPDQVMFDAADGTFTAVTGDATEAVVLYKDTGTDTTSPLIAYYDGASVQLTPNGNDVNFTISASGLLRWARA
jgi:hypothetical protein